MKLTNEKDPIPIRRALFVLIKHTINFMALMAKNKNRICALIVLINVIFNNFILVVLILL